MEQLMKKGLDGTQLKTVALVLMVLDHIHYFFEFTGWVPTWFSMLGRLSAPLFLFCTVEGFAHTLSLIHISEPTRLLGLSRMPSSA